MLGAMRWIIVAMLVAGALEFPVGAQEAVPPASTPAPAAAPPGSGNLSPEDSARYVGLKLDETRLETQLKLLTELADEHLKRSEAARSERLDSEKWEIARSQELRDRALTVARLLNDATKARLAFEEAHLPPITTAVSIGGLGSAVAPDPNEQAYLTRLERRFAVVTAEWLAAIETSRLYAVQLGTNRVPEEAQRISVMLSEISHQARELEKEQADLELRKLEFRALRK